MSFKEVKTVDVALALVKNQNIKAPSGATGAPLIEVLGDLVPYRLVSCFFARN